MGKSWKPTRIIAEMVRPAARKYCIFFALALVLKARTKLIGRVVIRKPTRLSIDPAGEKVLAVKKLVPRASKAPRLDRIPQRARPEVTNKKRLTIFLMVLGALISEVVRR